MQNIKTNRKPFKKPQAKNSHCIQRMTTTLTGDISSNDGGGVNQVLRSGCQAPGLLKQVSDHWWVRPVPDKLFCGS